VDIHVVNPEGLPWLNRSLANTHKWPWDMLVVDESTKFKHTRSLRFKLLKPMLNRFRRRYILTGSPVPNGLMDLFGQIYILDLGNSLGQYITHYRINYFSQTGFGGYEWRIQPGAERRIYDKIAPLTMRMSQADYLQLPPLINSTIEIDLPSEARRVYKEMEDLMMASIGSDSVLAANAAAATNKCRQIANGGIYHEGGEAYTNLHDEKADAVADLVEQLQGKPCLIAYEYRHDLERLHRRFGGNTPYIGGGVSPSRFREIEAAWNMGEIPILLAQPQSVAHGLNLQGTGAAVIWHSIPWDLEVYEQFVRRVWRQGQKERVFNYHIVARGTVDEAVMKALAAKDRTQKALLSALRDYARGET
jgi:SNF2 family DNA or RNA helicase